MRLDYKAGKKVDSFTLKNIPYKITLSFFDGVITVIFEPTKSTYLFRGALTSANYKKYQKELSTLFKDFDDIFGEVNQKYRLSAKLDEIKTKYDKKTDFSKFTFKKTPIVIEMSYDSGGVIILFDVGNAIKSYNSSLSLKDYNRYKKEILDLFKDFDDIFGEVNQKYNLKKE